jgi:hypothetical protein
LVQVETAEKTRTAPALWAVRFLPCLTDLAYLLPMFWLFGLAKGSAVLLADCSTGFQLRAGDWISDHGHVPTVDPFSFSKPNQRWFAWEWGWDVLFSTIHRVWGLGGVVLVNAIILSLIAVALFRLIRNRAPNDVLAFGLTLAAMGASRMHWLARPHLLSWLLVLILLHVIERWKRGSQRALWVLPALTMVWANVHGSFFIVPLTLGLYAAGLLFDELIEAGRWQWNWNSPLSHCLLCLCACLATSFVNPYGLELHRHIVSYLMDSRQLDVIGEFKSPDFHDPAMREFELLLFLGLFAAFSASRLKNWGEALCVLVWTHFALHSARNIPLFAFMAAGPVASMLRSWAIEWSNGARAAWLRIIGRRTLAFGSEFAELERMWRLPLVPVAATLLLAVLLLGRSHPPGFEPEFSPQSFPAGAFAAMERMDTGRIFAEDQWGDYLLYRRYPNVKVFVDDRSDYYGAAFLKKWADALGAKYDWSKVLTSYRIQTVLLRVTDPLATVLKGSPAWTVAYDDGLAIVFVKRENAQEGSYRIR